MLSLNQVTVFPDKISLRIISLNQEILPVFTLKNAQPVQLNGFAEILVEGVEIWDASEFVYVLEELLAPVSDLYVTPLGYATWSAGGVVPFEPVMENFDEGLPETWTVAW